MLRHLAPLAAFLMLAPAAFAQNQPGKSPNTKNPPTKISKPPAPKSTAPAPSPASTPTQPPTPPAEVITLAPDLVEMSNEILRLETAGVTIHLPLGSVSQSTSAADKVSAKITPAPPDASWLIDVQNPHLRDKTHTAESFARSVLLELQKSVGEVDRTKMDREGRPIEKLVSTRATVIEPVKRVIVKAERPEFERPAARFYIKMPTGDKADFIRGYTVFQTAQGEFVTFELKTLEPNFQKSRPVYEATIASARFTDAAALATARGAAIESGVNFFAKIAAPDYDAAIATLNDQYYRLCKPALGGADKDAEEIAYRRVRAERGPRGKIDPNSNPAKWGAAEREPGIIIRFDARYLLEGQVIDTVGVYWMSASGTQEAWNLQQALRDPKKRNPTVLTETGARDGDSMAVTVSGTGQENRRVKPEVPKMGYITQVQSFLLPTLLTQKHAIGDYGFYVYKSQNETRPITMRRDSVSEATDGSSNLILTSHQSENVADQVSTYDQSGKLIHTISAAEKSVWTPTTLQQLVDLWKQKNLPMN